MGCQGSPLLTLPGGLDVSINLVLAESVKSLKTGVAKDLGKFYEHFAAQQQGVALLDQT